MLRERLEWVLREVVVVVVVVAVATVVDLQLTHEAGERLSEPKRIQHHDAQQREPTGVPSQIVVVVGLLRPGRRLLTHNTFSLLNFRFDRGGKYKVYTWRLFIGCERV